MQGESGDEVMPPPTEGEIDHGVPLFLDQMVDALRLGLRSSPEIGRSAVLHGHDLLLQGFTVSQVVHDYGDVCQTITELAVEMNAPISTDDFRSLNRCLDEAIAAPSPDSDARISRPSRASRTRERAPRVLRSSMPEPADTAIRRSRCSRRETWASPGAPAPSSNEIHEQVRSSLVTRRVSLPQAIQNREQFMVSEFIENSRRPQRWRPTTADRTDRHARRGWRDNRS